jgi:hypothetical protein
MRVTVKQGSIKLSYTIEISEEFCAVSVLAAGCIGNALYCMEMVNDRPPSCLISEITRWISMKFGI